MSSNCWNSTTANTVFILVLSFYTFMPFYSVECSDIYQNNHSKSSREGTRISKIKVDKLKTQERTQIKPNIEIKNNYRPAAICTGDKMGGTMVGGDEALGWINYM